MIFDDEKVFSLLQKTPASVFVLYGYVVNVTENTLTEINNKAVTVERP